MFRAMFDRIKANTFKVLTRLRLRRVEEEEQPAPLHEPEAAPATPEQDEAAKLGFKHTAQPSSLSYSGPSDGSKGKKQKQPVKREEPRVGRNDPCPCGSGKKYKKCCGAGV